MLDVGFWELLVIAVVALLVLGPERLPEVAKQAAFFVRKARQGMFRLRNEMRSEIDGTPFADLQKAKQEMTEFKNDIKQLGNELADSAEEKIEVDDFEATGSDESDIETEEGESPKMHELHEQELAEPEVEQQLAEQNEKGATTSTHRKARKKSTKKARKKTTKKARKKASKKTTKND